MLVSDKLHLTQISQLKCPFRNIYKMFNKKNDFALVIFLKIHIQFEKLMSYFLNEKMINNFSEKRYHR